MTAATIPTCMAWTKDSWIAWLTTGPVAVAPPAAAVAPARAAMRAA